MNRKVFCAAGSAAAALAVAACGGRVAGVPASDGEASTIASLEQGGTMQRAYVGVTNELAIGVARRVATFDLVGGAQVELEVVTRDASPLRFELWQAHVDGTATLRYPVDAASGLALDRIAADEDAT